MTSVWDDPDLKISDDYVRFDNPGDTVTGKVLSIRTHRFDDGKVAPQILLDVDGQEKTLTAGQVRLKAALAEQRPERGDVVTITLTEIETRGGGRTLKHFDVAVNRGGDASAPAASASAAPAAKQTLDLDSLDADQRAALKALL